MDEVCVLGIEIGGTKLQLGIGHGQGDLSALVRLRVDPTRGASGILSQIRAAVPDLLKQSNLEPHQIQAIGIGFGGPVDAAAGQIETSFQIAGWDHFPLADWITEHLDVPWVVVENDADSAGLAEARFGAGLDRSPLLYVNVGSGIGGSMIIDRQIYRGAGQGALEIGHMRVVDATDSDRPIRELEQIASGWAMATAGQELARQKVERNEKDWVVLEHALGNPGAITGVMIADAAKTGDRESMAILARARAAVAFALAQTITLLAPRRIVLGGGVSLIGESLWLDPIRRLVDLDVFPAFRGHYDIVPAALGEVVVVYGALALARDLVVKSA